MPDPPNTNRENVDADRENEMDHGDDPVAAAAEPTIREGSPFRVDPEPIDEQVGRLFERDPSDAPEAFYDIGPARYLALGAVVAASVVMIFAVLSLIWFPGGGVLVAGLGCLLGILGLFSPRPKSAGGLLAAHFSLFIACYVRMIGS